MSNAPAPSAPSASSAKVASIQPAAKPECEMPTRAAGEPVSAQRYETILVERRERVGLITLNRPKTVSYTHLTLPTIPYV